MISSTWRKAGLLLLSLLFHVGAEAQHKYQSYPDYLEVLEHAYSNYRLKCESCTVSLVKDPEGWAVAIEVRNEARHTHRLWSYARRKYVKAADLKRLEKGEARSAMERNADSPWTASYYRYCPYYGYPGWFLDVTGEYAEEKSLPDSIVYGVARAYASAARCRISDQVAECPVGYGYTEGEDGDQLSAEEIADYKALANLCTIWYDRLVARDPHFETHVGEAPLKRDNEVVSNYIDLMLVQNEADARPFLHDDLYDGFYRGVARNYLNSCDSNAILFTNGDSDSFPLWYLQAVEGYRTDVLVLNVSLLNLGRYIRVIRQGPWGAEPLQLLVNDAEWAQRGSDYVLFRSDSTRSIPAAEVLGALKAHVSAVRPDQQPLTLDHDKVMIVREDGLELAWTLPKQYLTRSGLVMLDILQAHAFDRPIHWAITSSPDAYRGLEEYLVLSGLTQKLLVVSDDSLARQDHIRKNASLFLDHFDWTDVQQRASNKDRFSANYLIQLASAAEALLSIGDTTQAERVLDRCVELFPDSNQPYDRLWLMPMQHYYAMGAFEEADRIALTLMNNLKTVPLERPTYSVSGTTDTVYLRQRVWERIHDTAAQYGRNDVIGAMDRSSSLWPDE